MPSKKRACLQRSLPFFHLHKSIQDDKLLADLKLQGLSEDQASLC